MEAMASEHSGTHQVTVLFVRDHDDVREHADHGGGVVSGQHLVMAMACSVWIVLETNRTMIGESRPEVIEALYRATGCKCEPPIFHVAGESCQLEEMESVIAEIVNL